MAIARLYHAVLLCQRSELETLLIRLSEFGDFCPIDKDGLIQDIDILLLSSRAQAVYSRASELLPQDYEGSSVSTRSKVVSFDARDISSLIEMLSSKLDTITEQLSASAAPISSDTLSNLLAVREAALSLFNNLRRTRLTFESKWFAILEGFVPSKHSESFRVALKDFLVSCEPLGKEESEETYVPTMLSNPRGVSLFENITLTRGFPKYSEVDPTPVTAVVFPFFFGIMFSDLGHGIVLFLLGYFLRRRYRGVYGYWGNLLMVLGSASMAMGFVRGLFFGIEFTTPLQSLLSFPAALTGGFTIDAVALWLEISIVIGTFHLSSGYAISVINRLHSKDYTEAFLNGVPTILLYSSAVPFVLAVIGAKLQFGSLFVDNDSTPFFKELLGVNIPVSLVAEISIPLFIISIITLVLGRFMITYSSGRGHWKFAKALALGFLEALVKPFEFFTNTISYLRLGILLILGTILVTLSIGSLSLGLVGIPIAIIANIAVMGIEGFMVYIQDLRLHVYEWLSNFYSGSGTSFEPLSMKGLYYTMHWK